MKEIKELESALSRACPAAWNEAENMRAKKGTELPYWSKWCYLPLAGWIAIASRGCDVSQITLDHTQAAALYAAIGPWRIGRGIYRFDETLFQELVSTPMEGTIPCDVLFRLPEWCIYIETKPLGFPGFFVHLEEDVKTGDRELRLLCLTDTVPMPLIVHLGDFTLAEGVRRSVETAERNMRAKGMDYSAENAALDAASIMKKTELILPLILYVCSANAEIRQVEREIPPLRKKSKGILEKVSMIPTTWEVGYRIGAAIRSGRSNEETSERVESQYPGSGTPKRPHVRRAHWHGYWTGPRDGKRLFSLQWLPPIPVKIDTGDGPMVIHPVQKEE